MRTNKDNDAVKHNLVFGLPTNESDLWIEQAWQESSHKVHQLHQRVGASFPHVVQDGMYQSESPQWWTAGFYPGILHLVGRESGDPELRQSANECEIRLEQVLGDPEQVDHDLGFIWLLTGVATYKQYGEQDSRRRSLLAANLLAARYNESGAFIRAWNFESAHMDTRGVAIIDCMMNLPLLYWASEETGDPRFAHIANRHAHTVLKHFIRSGYSVCHTVEFDPETGEMLTEHGGQGFAKGSAWARGTSWALHGFALAYGYTGHAAYLQAAEGIADFFLASLGEEIVPVWDFRATEPHRGAKDSSATAIAASGLLELAKHSSRGDFYRQEASRLLHGLHVHFSAPADEEGLVILGTVHYPERRSLNVPIIYGDYFFLEGLAKLRGYSGLF
ncbi:glycoside hydrolase family 88 protein [Saccharibacillus sp. JS10]|uniref:glycoside hydrolase family 88 protein n=1 Tax=Saccharibacillus sp. JS10 TaxID=2950552 RepID=UPI00210A443D|nr:glycoside hydrolase family 88 protein [Saccharibacillus sp. JS10]MCQ4086795.1 glycoside hydrolase family 88 protein [Saccharibacillus sp. JS10]